MNASVSANLTELLRERAQAHPDRVAVHLPPGPRARSWRAMTFSELDRAADALAHGLAAAGLRPGDRTLLMVKPSADFYGLVFGLLRVGAVPVFIDPGMGLRKALSCVADVAPRGLVALPVVNLVRQVWRRPFRAVEVAITSGRWGLTGPTLASCARTEAGPYPTAAVSPDDDAVIVFTSGSTGPAKGVALTHRCMRARVDQIQELFGLEPGTRILETLLVYTVLEVCMGLEVCVPPMELSKPATVDPAAVAATFERFRPQVASASPVVWQRLVRHAEREGLTFPGMRLLLTTAAPIPVRLHARLGPLFGEELELYTPYGATEAMPISRIGTHRILRQTAAATGAGGGTCVGERAPGMELRVVRRTDGPIEGWTDDLLVAPGEIGEIVVRGDGVSPGYRAAPEADRAARIPDAGGSWHRMGDLGRIDADGLLWFCGRVAHAVDTSEGLLAPVCVEGVFNQHPDVARTALVGVGPRGAQVPVLCVELEPGKRWSPALHEALGALTRGTPFEGRVTTFLPHPGFPTDARHNSKIRREDLAVWAARQIPAT